MGFFHLYQTTSNSSSSSVVAVVYSVSIGIGIGAVGLTIFYLQKKVKDSWKYVGTVDRISIYPIKGLKGFQVGGQSPSGDPETDTACTDVMITPAGLKCGDLYDRCFVLGSNSNKRGKFEFVTMRSIPKLVLIDVTPTDESFSSVTLSAPDMDDIVVHFPKHTNEKVDLELYSSPSVGIKCEESVNRWFQSYLQREDVYLVCAMDNTKESVCTRDPSKDPKIGKYSPPDMRVIYSDSTPVMLTTTASHDDINSKLRLKNRPQMSIDSWKANLIVKTENESLAFSEDVWGQVALGDEVTLERVRPCHRCAVVKVDPKTGTHRKDEEPLRTLRTYRMIPAFNSPIFGSLLHVSTPGRVWVGMSVYAVEEKFRAMD